MHNNEKQRVNELFLRLYFLKLNYNQQKYILENFESNVLKNTIQRFTSLFIQYPFYNEVIINETHKDYKINDVIEWQKHFYIGIYKEYHNSNKNHLDSYIINLYHLLQEKNSSFGFLINLEKSFNQASEEESSSSLLKSLIDIYSVQNSEKASKLKKSDKPSTLDSSFVEDEKDDNDFINKLISKLKY